MSRPKISQRDAHRLRKRVTELEQAEQTRVAAYRSDYPGGVHLVSIDMSMLHESRGRLQGASRLGAALVGKIDGQELRVFGVIAKESA